MICCYRVVFYLFNFIFYFKTFLNFQGASGHIFQSPPYAIGIPLGKDGAIDPVA